MRLFSSVFAALVFLAGSLRAETVSVAAAADLAFCLDDLDAAFAKLHPETTIQVSTGSSGNFFSQIERGAPFDVFLSADKGYAQKLVDEGFAEKESLYVYATGKLMLWTAKPGIDLSRGLKILSDPSIGKIAIANPDHAPYGRAAKAALQHEGLWDSLQPKIVLGENIAQTLQFAQSGNADVALVARALVAAPKLAGQGKSVEVPADFYPALEQAAVQTKKGVASSGAKAYLEFLRTPGAREIFKKYGFGLPAER